jgi:hypothetical protein
MPTVPAAAAGVPAGGEAVSFGITRLDSWISSDSAADAAAKMTASPAGATSATPQPTPVPVVVNASAWAALGAAGAEPEAVASDVPAEGDDFEVFRRLNEEKRQRDRAIAEQVGWDLTVCKQ